MQWIKASERLPENEVEPMEVVFRNIKTKNTLNIWSYWSSDQLELADADYIGKPVGTLINKSEVEWLDESTPAITSSIIKTLEEANPYKLTPCGKGNYSDPAGIIWDDCVSELRALLSAQPAEQGDAIDNLLDKITPGHQQQINYAMDLEIKNDVLVKALERITEPIKHMLSDLKEGEQLNGQYTIQLSNDPEYLKSIARKALEQFTTPSPYIKEENK